MQIPIQNIYYLLCYAWDKLEARDVVNVSANDASDLLDLFAKVLVSGTTYLFKRGLDRYYIDREEAYCGIKGKFLVDASLKRNSLITNRTICAFDEFSFDILHNQIVKTTCLRLLRAPSLNSQLHDQLKKLLIKFPPVNEIVLQPRIFTQVRLNKNNYFYDFVLKICEIIFCSTLIDEKTGTLKFRDFLRDETRMAHLFEAFVRNFYRRELSEFKVTREDIYWNFKSINCSTAQFLPKMQTDISLTSQNRKIIIDTKYKSETLQQYFDAEKIHSANLYQLFAYLKNIESKDELGPACEGILLYPTVNRDIYLEYAHENHKIKICTLNLNQHWKKIESDLKNLVN